MTDQIEQHDVCTDIMDNILRHKGWDIGHESREQGCTEEQCRQWVEKWVLHFTDDEEIRKEIKDDVMHGWRSHGGGRSPFHVMRRGE